MYRLRLNSIGTRVRKEVLNGKEYLVAHGTLIVPGVLNGSAGALLYPPKEVAKSVTSWNRVPIVLNHPYRDGKPISAREPKVLNQVGIGEVFNARKGKDGKLQAELWFDVAALMRIDNRLLEQIRNGEKVEISTGLNAKKYPAPKSAVYNGKEYIGIVRHYRPDHLAVLVDSKGACSINDGCGIHNKRKVNSSNGEFSMLTAKQRKRYIDFLVDNCDCWSGENDRKVLAKLPDSKLVSLRKGVIKHKKSEEVLNSLRKDFSIPEDTELTSTSIRSVVNSSSVDDEDEDEEEDDEDEDDVARKPKGKKKKAPVVNKKAAGSSKEDDESSPKKLTPKEWFEQAPEEVQEVFNRARSVNSKAKTAIIEKLVANVKNKKQRAEKVERFNKMKLEQLEDLLDLLPQDQQQVNNGRKSKGEFDDFLEGSGDYRGAAGPVTNRNRYEDDDEDSDTYDEFDADDDDENSVTNARKKNLVLPLTVVNFDDESFDDEYDAPVNKKSRRSA